IAYALEPRKGAYGVTAKAFMLHRLIRLYPLFLLGIVMGLGVHVLASLDKPVDDIDIGKAGMEIVPQLFMMPSLNADKHLLFTLYGPAWSLFFELWVNLAYIVFFR